jgi:hypothetical protein
VTSRIFNESDKLPKQEYQFELISVKCTLKAPKSFNKIVSRLSNNAKL